MTLHEKKDTIRNILNAVNNVRSAEELFTLSGKLFYELFSSFDAEQVRSMESHTELIVQSILIPAARHIGRERPATVRREMELAIGDIMSLFDDSYILE